MSLSFLSVWLVASCLNTVSAQEPPSPVADTALRALKQEQPVAPVTTSEPTVTPELLNLAIGALKTKGGPSIPPSISSAGSFPSSAGSGGAQLAATPSSRSADTAVSVSLPQGPASFTNGAAPSSKAAALSGWILSFYVLAAVLAWWLGVTFVRVFLWALPGRAIGWYDIESFSAWLR